ncbi:Crp/Fnr family transcriptional regulator [Streptomyces sp. NPDC048603]|uniref:Crp/Fnr family transcriptional regulator n=1 Tax=Streptomyces sp. NPDC048603 TaxID=3365577 RepID=UPI00371F286F
MTELVEYPEGRTVHSWPYRAAGIYLKSLGLPTPVVESLLQAARLDAPEKGTVFAYGPEWIHIVAMGVVKETTPHGTERLWTKGALFGDLGRVMLKRGTSGTARGVGPRITFLTQGCVLSLTTRTLGQLLEQDSVLVLLLAQLTNERSETVESVYAASKADPVIRVARLLDYLVQYRRPLPSVPNRVRWTRNGMHLIPSGALTVQGPSQADIAEALGLGRTTVEKALASLRDQGALTAHKPGTRSNRYYEIMDIALLRSIACSES